MAFDYRPLEATALKLISDFGALMTLVIQVPGAYDPETLKATQTEQSLPVQAVFMPLAVSFQPGTQVDTSTRRVLIAAKGLATPPMPGHDLRFGSDNYRIETTKASNPNGVLPLLYDCTVVLK
jgi:hypothetical protein